MTLQLKKLSKFLVKAKINSYVANANNVESQRPNFKELAYKEGDFYYRDSYVGYYYFSGQETVYFKNKVVWIMSYNGGMLKKFHNNLLITLQTYSFLKKVLLLVDEEQPYRGPKEFEEGDFKYLNELKGDIKNFKGTEKIFLKGGKIYEVNYIGGLIIGK